MTALKNLVEAFLRWHEEAFEPSALHSNVRHAARVLKLDIQEDRPVPTPAAIAFIFSLPLINPWELPEDRRECDICGEMMHVESDWSEDHRFEVAALLECGHITGYRCLEAWLNPLQGMNNNTCPYCRAVCFEKFADEDTIEGLQERLGVLEWGLETYTRGPNSVERAQLDRFRINIVSSWLDKALVELEHERAKLEREIAEQVLATPTFISAEYSLLVEFDLRESLVEGIELQLRQTQLRMESGNSAGYHGEARDTMARALDIVWEDGDVEVEGSDAWETEEEVDEIEEGEIVEGGETVAVEEAETRNEEEEEDKMEE